MSLLTGIDSVRVINLAHRGDRMDLFSKNHPFLQFERVDAVYGKTIVLNPEIYKIFKNNIFGWKKNVIGCTLSHYREWQKIANGDLGERVLVLEDDAVFDKDFIEKWEKMVKDIPSDTDVIFLGGILPCNKGLLSRITESVNESFARIAKNMHYGSETRICHFGTYSYIISKTGAKKMCDKILNLGICQPIDGFMMFYDEANFNQYFSTPLLIDCTQADDPNFANTIDFTNQLIHLYDTDIQNSTDRFSIQDIMTVSGQKLFGLDSIIVAGYCSEKMEAFSKYNPFLEGKCEHSAFDFENLEVNTEIETLFKNNDFNWDKQEVGRTLMHYRIWQKLASGDCGDRILILEDSALICSNFDELCSKMLYDIGANVDLVYLGGVEQKMLTDFLQPVNTYISKPKQIDNWPEEMTKHKVTVSPYAYILTKKGAQKICMLIDRVGFCVKLDILLLYLEKLLNIHFSVPLLCSNILQG